MTLVINFFFQTLRDVWEVIYSNWILAISFMLAVISFVVGLVNKSKEQK